MHRHFAEIDSTNEEALRWGREDASHNLHGALITAETQTAGRGRRGRSWSSPPGGGLYFSLILQPQTAQWAGLVPQLNFAACLATVRAAREVADCFCQTKWPNDVLLNGRKISGVLSEAEIAQGELSFVVVGVGLNVNQSAEELPERPIYPASSLRLETGKTWPIEPLLKAWQDNFWRDYERLRNDNWPEVRADFWQCCAQREQIITVRQEDKFISGTALALDADGALLLNTVNGPQRILAGDILSPE